MRAIVYTKYGSPDVLEVKEVEKPIPRDDQVLIKVHAVMVAKCSYSRCIKALKPGGRYLMANPRISDMLRSVLTSMFTDRTAIFAFAGEREEELLALKEMIEGGKINSVVDRVYSFEQAAEAHRRVETEQRLGTVVISAEPNQES